MLKRKIVLYYLMSIVFCDESGINSERALFRQKRYTTNRQLNQQFGQRQQPGEFQQQRDQQQFKDKLTLREKQEPQQWETTPHRFELQNVLHHNMRRDDSAIVFPDDEILLAQRYRQSQTWKNPQQHMQQLSNLPQFDTSPIGRNPQLVKVQGGESRPNTQEWNQPFPLVFGTQPNPSTLKLNQNQRKRLPQGQHQELNNGSQQGQENSNWALFQSQETRRVVQQEGSVQNMFTDNMNGFRQFVRCMEDCKTTNEYNPVCGTNGETYSNRAKLLCSRRCGAGKKNDQIDFGCI